MRTPDAIVYKRLTSDSSIFFGVYQTGVRTNLADITLGQNCGGDFAI